LPAIPGIGVCKLPDPKRADACTAVIAGGHVVIIDAGPGAWAKLAQASVPPAQIGTVLLTHLHSDHISDLGEVARQSWIVMLSVPFAFVGGFWLMWWLGFNLSVAWLRETYPPVSLPRQVTEP
jgi:ribonuclease BN (tRNA processing enzyme)